MELDRTNINRALAKAIAYRQVGDMQQATRWAVQLVRELAMIDIITPSAQEIHASTWRNER